MEYSLPQRSVYSAVSADYFSEESDSDVAAWGIPIAQYLKKQFNFFIQAKDWQPTDTIVAEGDYGETIVYPNTSE